MSTLSNIAVAIVSAALLSNVSAYVSSTNLPRFAAVNSPKISTSLNAWGVQKLGQAVIDLNPKPQGTTVDDDALLRFRPSVGSGDDERLLVSADLAVQDGIMDFQLLSKIEIGLTQQQLFKSLTGFEFSQPQKLNMVANAMGSGGVLPSSLFSSNIPRTSSLKHAGLLSDWEMSI
eukprot:gene7741-15833_t